jgi:hypothetical protein
VAEKPDMREAELLPGATIKTNILGAAYGAIIRPPLSPLKTVAVESEMALLGTVHSDQIEPPSKSIDLTTTILRAEGTRLT